MNKNMENVRMRGISQEPIQIEGGDIEKVIKTLKRKKAGDQEGWINEMIIEGGEEMVKSLRILFNRIVKEIKLLQQR